MAERKTLKRFGPIVLMPSIWWVASMLLGEDRLPDPLRTCLLLVSSANHNELINAQGGGSHGYAPHVWSTFWHVAVAATTGAAFGILVVLFASQFLLSRLVVNNLLELTRTLPPLIFVPFAASVIGASDWTRLISIGCYTSLSISVYAIEAFANVPPQYDEMAYLLGASRVRRILTVQLPASLPHLLGPLRLVYSFGLGISIVVEYLAADSGIGRVMKEMTSYTRADLIVVGVVWTVILSLFFDALLVAAFARSLRWTDRQVLLRWLAH